MRRIQQASKLGFLVLPLLLVLAACGSTAPAPVVGNSAPTFQLTTYSNNQSVSLSDYKGKPVMLNFWATWCDDCQAEMTTIQSAYQKYQSQGLVILGIDVKEQPQNVATFLQTTHLNLTWPILMDKDENVAQLYNQKAYPTSVFIDRKGIIRSIVVGGLDPTTLPTHLDEIVNS